MRFTTGHPVACRNDLYTATNDNNAAHKYEVEGNLNVVRTITPGFVKACYKPLNFSGHIPRVGDNDFSERPKKFSDKSAIEHYYFGPIVLGKFTVCQRSCPTMCYIAIYFFFI